ncbi:neurofilament heavy polypeptide-like isoform X2 [Oscarella lobularis]|uniref:neurofilament heavy polypeptide-like isoform X2 n=1 Tax=Oscarella lobularis TaxID=121494 RepID=UPI003313807B
MVSATTGAAILGIIALLFTVASIVLALALCKLLGKCGFRRVYQKRGLLHFQNKTYDVEIRGSSRRSKSEWVDSRIYEDLDTPKLTKKTKCKASKTSLLSYDENVFESTGTVVRNKGYRESAECIELQTKADVHSKDETETVDLIDTEKKNTSDNNDKEATKQEVEVCVTEEKTTSETTPPVQRNEEEKTSSTKEDNAQVPQELVDTYAKVDLVKKWARRSTYHLKPPEPSRPPSDYISDSEEMSPEPPIPSPVHSEVKPPEPARPPSDVFSETDESALLLSQDSSERPVSAIAYENFAFDDGEKAGEKDDGKTLSVVYEDTQFPAERNSVVYEDTKVAEEPKPRVQSMVYEDVGYEDLEDVQEKVKSLLQKEA